MAVPRQHLKTTTLSSKGQITVSSEARKRLHIEQGDHLMEIVLEGCVVYMPADSVLEDVTSRAQAAFSQAGLSVDALKSGVEARKMKRLVERYPNLSND